MKIQNTFKAVCFRKMSLDLNITAAIQIVTKKPATPCIRRTCYSKEQISPSDVNCNFFVNTVKMHTI